jgi:NAD(P)-dependent dehydrogenase (short-subunit alcohol dehydrogenase family)
MLTGAAGAIGSAILEQLIARGETVIAQDLRQEALENLPGSIIPLAGNLLDDALYERLGEIIADTPLQRVIAAHGMDGSAPLAKIDSAFYRRVLAVNGESAVRLLGATRTALNRAEDEGPGAVRSTFVVVSSQAGIVAEADNTAYSASKSALIGWARSLRSTLSAEGIALRVAAPGCTQTPLFLSAQAEFAAANGMSTEAFLQRRLDRIPVGRFASTAQTAAAVVYLSERTAARPFMLAGTGGETRH